MLKKILIFFLFLMIFLSNKVFAQFSGEITCDAEPPCDCSGKCDESIDCQTVGSFNDSAWDTINDPKYETCPNGVWVIECTTYDTKPTNDPDDPYDFVVGGDESPSNTICTQDCDENNQLNEWDDTSCIISNTTQWCACPEDIIPTATPTPDPDDPAPTATPTVAARYIRGTIYDYENAGFVGSFCGGQSTQEQISPFATNIYAHQDGSSVVNGGIVNGTVGEYLINMTASATGQSWDITLNLPSDGLLDSQKLVCGCPAPIDPADPFTCQYSGVSDTQTGVDFYLLPYSMASSWFQTFGGNVFARTSINSILPIANCVLDGSCEDSLIAKAPSSTNPLTSGFALTSGSANTGILTNSSLTDPRSYINSSDRTDNLNAYATSVEINSYGYAFYANKLSGEIDISRPGGTLDLNEVRTDDNWVPNETNIILVNGDLAIDETHNWDVESGDSVVVLVNGNLNISDNDPDSGLDQVVSTDQGGFLAFFAANNITFDESIGYSIDPAAPTIPAVTDANSNVQGVFVADNILTIDGFEATDVPDRKFIGSGTFVGWTNVDLARDFDDEDQGATLSSLQAVENFIFRPDFMANFPDELKVVNSNWREINPQYLDQ